MPEGRIRMRWVKRGRQTIPWREQRVRRPGDNGRRMTKKHRGPCGQKEGKEGEVRGSVGQDEAGGG